MSEVIFLLNAHAGRVDPVELRRAARRALWGYDLHFAVMSDQAHGLAILRDLNPSRFRAVVVCGGDGTLNGLLPGLQGLGIPLLMLPYGTANDLAATLGSKRDWDLVQRILDTGTRWDIDLIEVNGRSFATVGGIGVGASLTGQINDGRSGSRVFRAMSGLLREELYTYMSAKTIVLESSWVHRVQIQAPGLEDEILTGIVMVCNQSFLAGGLLVAPAALQDDGYMDVMIGDVSHRQELLRLLYDMKRGRSSPKVRQVRTTSLCITSIDGEELEVFGDGETMLSATKLEFKVLPGALSVLRAPALPAGECL